ncbi:MAG TPA: FKBP-type peptidyl-prolyl cis-trans isomerase [Polyangiaceae bacterium]|nr:FKBP-type peptidyl-prolyl cis-trans isomerase [Polyangiaceae bacterium]
MSPTRVLPAVACALALSFSLGCSDKVPEPAPEPMPARVTEPPTPEPADLIKEDLVVGTGAEAKEGDKVKVHYTGRLLKTNFVFDSSIGPGKKPLELTLGAGSVIKGWEQGIPGMKVGGKRKLTIPSKLAYGDAGQPPKIPAKATLVFDVELLSIGEGNVIKGWEQGVPGMKVGGKRKLTIPSKLAYGDAGSPPKIPGKATLVFDIELLGAGGDADAGAGDAGSGAKGAQDAKNAKDKKKPAAPAAPKDTIKE